MNYSDIKQKNNGQNQVTYRTITGPSIPQKNDRDGKLSAFRSARHRIVDCAGGSGYYCIPEVDEMSILFALKNTNGITMASESRLICDGSVVTDSARKVFKAPYFLLGVTGTFDVFYDTWDKKHRLLDEVIKDLLKENEYLECQEFFELLEKEIQFSCQFLDNPNYYFVFGFKTKDGKYAFHEFTIQKNGIRKIDRITFNNGYIINGENWLVPSEFILRDEWNLEKLQSVAHQMVRQSMDAGDIFCKPNPLGGNIQSEIIV